jgi:Alcohol dehydrogenase, class IV
MLSKNDLKDICTFTSPRQGTMEDIINILEKASQLEFEKSKNIINLIALKVFLICIILTKSMINN